MQALLRNDECHGSMLVHLKEDGLLLIDANFAETAVTLWRTIEEVKTSTEDFRKDFTAGKVLRTETVIQGSCRCGI